VPAFVCVCMCVCACTRASASACISVRVCLCIHGYESCASEYFVNNCICSQEYKYVQLGIPVRVVCIHIHVSIKTFNT